MRRWTEAQEFFDRMLAPDADLTHVASGLNWLRNADSTRTTPPASDPDSDEDALKYIALRKRAVARAHLKQFDAAEADLAAAIALRPNDAQAYGTATWVRLFSGAYAEGRDSALKSLQIDKTQIWVRINLAHAYLLEGQFEWARSIYLGDGGKPEDGDKTRAQRALADFADLRASGVDEVELARMEKLLREARTPAQPSPTP